MTAEQQKEKRKRSTSKSSPANEYVLTGELTLHRAAEIKTGIVKAIQAKGEAVFRFDEVGEIDLSLVQILCSAHRTAYEAGKTIRFEGEWPQNFVSLLAETGLDEHVGCSLDGSVECAWVEAIRQ